LYLRTLSESSLYRGYRDCHSPVPSSFCLLSRLAITVSKVFCYNKQINCCSSCITITLAQRLKMDYSLLSRANARDKKNIEQSHQMKKKKLHDQQYVRQRPILIIRSAKFPHLRTRYKKRLMNIIIMISRASKFCSLEHKLPK
jgi:hypothetical protein